MGYDQAAEIILKADPGVWHEVVTANGYRIIKDEFKGEGVLDIGAYTGAFSYQAIVLGGASWSIVVEPDPTIFNLLATLHLPLLPYPAAIGDGRSSFIELTGEGPSKRSHPAQSGQPSRTIKQVLNQQTGLPKNPTVLKIDCEGAEFGALFSADIETIRSFKSILIEVHGWTLQELGLSGNSREVMTNYLTVLGFNRTMDYQMYAWHVYPNGERKDMKPLDAYVMRFSRED